MKLGAEPKKVAMLVGLLVVAGGIVVYNYLSGDSGSNEAPRPVAAAVPQAPPPAAVKTPAATTRSAPSGIARDDRRRAKQTTSASEFSFREGTEPGEDKPDPATIDPTLRLDLLAKVQKVEMPASLRNIFQYGAAPPPAPVKPIELPKDPPKIAVNNPAPVAPVGPPLPPPPPTAPPMTFKYYGYKVSTSSGRKVAFLLDGEDIIIAGENDAMKAGRYKIVSIGVNSITIEDTQFKSNQTLMLQTEAAV